jgi:TonB family protein
MFPANKRLKVAMVLLLAGAAGNLVWAQEQKNDDAAKPAEGSAQALYAAAQRAGSTRDYSNCAQLLEEALAKDPEYKPALVYLGWTYNTLGKYEKAEPVLRKAIALNPSDRVSYNNLGQALAGQKKYEEAISQYQKQIEINARDRWAHANMGRVYNLMHQYYQAALELEIATSITPDDPYVHFNLGRAYGRSGQAEKATKALMRSVELQPVPFRWNEVAYEMAVDNLGLEQAQKYAESAIAATVLEMQNPSLEHVVAEDTRHTAALAAYWDTFGWVRFQQGKVGEAEKYVKSAWLLRSIGIITDHLGQIYEKEGRKEEAIRMYEMALATTLPVPETRGRLATLLGSDAEIDQLTEKAKPMLKEARTIVVKNSRQATGIGQFWIVVSPGPKVRGVKYIMGDDELAPLTQEIEAAAFPDCFPEATEVQIIRRGTLSCAPGSPNCSLLMNSADTVQPTEVSGTGATFSGPVNRIRLGANVLTTTKIKNKVEPVYPIEARAEGIEGTVRLHAIIGKDGSILELQVISGRDVLTKAALDAVKKWKYEPTLLNGQPVEVETTIDVIFALNKKD